MLLAGVSQGGTSVIPDAVSTYIGGTTDAVDRTTYTFTDHAIGVAAADRYVLVGILGGASAARTISSVTIGGVTASAVGSFLPNSSDSTLWVAFYIALVPTGTTGTIVITYSASCGRTRVGVWSITGLISPVATDTASDLTSTAGVVSDTIDVVAGGCAFGIYTYIMATTPDGVAAWAGLTERADLLLETTQIGTSASENFAAAQTGLTVSATITGTGAVTKPAFLAVALR